MKKNRIIAIVLAVALVGSLAGVSAFAASGNTQSAPAADTAAQKKDVQETTASHTSSETVYVIANADGSAQKVIVSQKYDADDANAAQEAQSTLTDPQNVKGDNCWQGTTDKALPVTVAITYTLDGKTVTAEELAGKSGHVTMRFDYTNTQYETKTIGGKQEKIYVPFAVLTGALLDSDHFTNVSVTNGKLVDDGDHTVVVGMAFPGLQETLALDTDTLEIPTYVEVEADVTGFTLDTTLTVVSNSLLNDMDDDKLDDSALDDLSADMDKLTDAMTQLMDGSDELYDGLDTLLDSSKELSDGVGKLTSGLKKLDSNSAQLNAGAETVFNTLLDTVNTQLQANEELKEAVIKDVVLLNLIGIKVVLVHGGGPEISEMLQKIGKRSEFVNGLRVTDAETAEVVQMVLAGKINKGLVNLLQNTGGRAIGLSGADGHMIEARQLDPALGYVGEITNVDTQLILDVLEKGYIPVISTVGCDSEGNVYNINADTAASRIAGMLRAESLISMTDISGILRDKDDPDSLIPQIQVSDAPTLMRDGIISGGMIPKVECCIEAIRRGVNRVFIIDGRIPHSILIETLTDEGIGTMFTEG